MRFTTFLLPALAAADLATITGVLDTITDQVGQLDAAVKAFSGDIAGVQTSATTLLQTLKTGTDTIKGTSQLTLIEASRVAQSSTGLNTTVSSVVDGLISKKDAFVSAGAGETVKQTLTDQKAASQALAEAITSKVPTELQSVAAELSAGVAKSLQRGIDAYTGTGGGSPSGSPSGSPTTGGSSPPSGAPTGGHTGHGSGKPSAPTSAPTSAPAGGAAKPTGGAPVTTSGKPAPATFTAGAVANRAGGVMGAVAAVAILAL